MDSVFGTGKISAMISSRSILLYTIIATRPPTGRDATVIKSLDMAQATLLQYVSAIFDQSSGRY